jgi:hypothetical protein
MIFSKSSRVSNVLVDHAWTIAEDGLTPKTKVTTAGTEEEEKLAFLMASCIAVCIVSSETVILLGEKSCKRNV